MKILQINATCGVSSTGRIAADIHQMLICQNHESKVAYARKKTSPCPDHVRFGGTVNFICHVFYTFLTDRHGFASRQATRRLLRLIDRYQPDLIHLHAIHGYYVNIGMLFHYLAKSGIPVVWTLHDCWSFTGHCAYYDYSGCQKWQTRCQHCPSLRDYPISLLLDNSARNFTDKRQLFLSVPDLTLVTPSAWLAEQLSHSFQRETPRQVIHNGVNLEVFRPLSSDFRGRNQMIGQFIILGAASVWNNRKGLKYFIDLADRLPDDCSIILVGLSSRQIRNLPKRIIGIRHLSSPADLAELYSTVDVFVNPTLEDNFPTTNLEALACGTPVVTFQTGGSPESIDERTGLVARRGDIDDLFAKILQIRQNGKAAYSAACRARAEAMFRREERYQQYIDLYGAVLDGVQKRQTGISERNREL